jgi:hypothetical protein
LVDLTLTLRKGGDSRDLHVIKCTVSKQSAFMRLGLERQLMTLGAGCQVVVMYNTDYSFRKSIVHSPSKYPSHGVARV